MFPPKTVLRDEKEPAHNIEQRNKIVKKSVSNLLSSSGTPEPPRNQRIHDADDREIDGGPSLHFGTRKERSG
jgi:hypothetical protein